jgi:hypothetical protein
LHYSRQRYPLDQIGHRLLCLERRKQPVREHRYGERLYVVGYYVVAPVERGVRTARTHQLQRGPGRRAEP